MYELAQSFDALLPNALCERYISVDGAALKVALYFLINKNADKSTLCSYLGISESAAERAINMWKTAGLIAEKGENGTVNVTLPADDTALAPAKRHINHDEMATALLGDSELASLLQETQRLLGKELSVTESRLLIETCQFNSLPAAVVLVLVSYWASVKPAKKVLTATARTAKEWSELGITTVHEAVVETEKMQLRKERAEHIAAILSLDCESLSKAEQNRINEWFEKFGYDESFVGEVLLRKPDANIAYVHSVLKDWNKKGYRTISDTRLVPFDAQPAPLTSNNGGSLLSKAIKRNNRKADE